MIVFFLFYSKADGKQARLAFNKEFLHCDTIIYDGESYIRVSFGCDGIGTRLLKAKNCDTLSRNLKIMPKLSAQIIVNVKDKHIKAWSPLWIKSCNEIARYVSGVDIGLTINPVHLHNKLLKYNNTSNYEILYAWTREKKPNPTNHKEVRNGYIRWWRRRCGQRIRHDGGTNTPNASRNTT